ncbi:MAG: DNA mismatch endonuclease Vsr [Saprospiraceae bacterium]|nr:DNA mismatch endonuclease Vsr [Saprospiraceae bacterium]
MPDIVSTAKRSQMMSGIRNKDTKIEVLFRKALFAKGFRYRLNSKKLPGKPDLLLPKYKTAIFIHGCFWHHHSCYLGYTPNSNFEFWEKKFMSNKSRDESQIKAIINSGYRILIIWECALDKKLKLPLSQIINQSIKFIHSNIKFEEISGKS